MKTNLNFSGADFLDRHIVFHSTSLVFKSERIVKKENINYKIVPTPKTHDQVYCGVCICIDENDLDKVEELLNNCYIEYYV